MDVKGKKIIIRRKFTEEFKLTVVREYESGVHTVLEMSRLFGISETNIYNWIYKYSAYNKKKVRIVEMTESSSKKVFVTGSGQVFAPDPGTYFEDTGLTYSSNVSAAYKSVSLEHLNNASGGYYYIKGTYAQSRNLYSPNFAPISSVNTNFSYTKNQTGFAKVNIYYFIDSFRSYIEGLNFSPMFIFANEEHDWIAFDAYAYSQPGDINSYYLNYPDDETEAIWFGYDDSTILFSHDQSIILHEYGHALHDALLSGGYGYGDVWIYSDLAGITEGIADYIGISYRRKMPNGDWRPNDISNYAKPFERTSIKISSQANYDDWATSDNYGKGSIWASAIMDLEYNTATYPTSGNNLGRDITTTLLLTSLSYVSKDKSPIDYVNAIMQADRDLYNGSHLQQIEEVFESRGFFDDYEVSGAITSNTTWSNYVLVTDDVTVNSGVTLTISNNTFVYFESGKHITVNGTLNVNGTSGNTVTFDRAGTSGTWLGIEFNSGSNGTISYANISNASCGIKCNGEDDVTINNCNISDCYMGIYSIYTNSIFDKPVVSNTEVTNCMNGIVAQFSHPDINNTDITSGYLAFYGYNSQSNFLNGYNGIYDNDAGIQAIGSNLKLGNSTTWGNNRLGLNDAANFNLSASSYSYIDAIGNYWGASSPSGINIEQGSTVNYTPYLSSDPTGAMLNISPLKPFEQTISYYIFHGDETGVLPVKYASAKQLLSEKKYSAAYAITKEIIDNYPNEKEAYYSISIIEELLSKAPYLNINNYILSKSSSVDKKDINGVLELLLINYEKEGKKNKYKTLKTKYSEFPVLEHVLYQNFLYYIHEEKDTKEAEKLLKQLEKEFSDSKMLTIARMELSIATNQIPFLAEDNSHNELINEKTESNIGVELTGNYPNPFNPTTIIKYQLPESGFVKIKIYNILGKEITTLVNETQDAGIHEVEFNAANLPSGIYIYTISANGFVQSKKMVLTK